MSPKSVSLVFFYTYHAGARRTPDGRKARMRPAHCFLTGTLVREAIADTHDSHVSCGVNGAANTSS